MKQIITTIILLSSLSISAQTTVVTGPKKKPQTTVVGNNKHQSKQQRKAAETAETKRKDQKRQEQLRKQREEQIQQEQLNKQQEEQARQDQLRKQQEEQYRQEQLRRELAERERQEKEKRNALRWDESQKALCFKGMTYNMIYVQGGTFKMGATAEQGKEPEKDEKPAHSVTVGSYYIGQTEVTQALWQAVMGKSLLQTVREHGLGTFGVGDNYPMYDVSWSDCQTFIEKLNSMTGRAFRLPTEAEWEFASRGGNNSRSYKYSGSNYVDNVAWYTNNSNSNTHEVAIKQPNELGIYDMSGNVWEWCDDWYDSNYYKNSDSDNPRGAYTGSSRVIRGGSWYYDGGDCRVSRRSSYTPDGRIDILGFRLVLVP